MALILSSWWSAGDANGEVGVMRPPRPVPSLLPASISNAREAAVASRWREQPRKM
jgi:hypothetical protein